MTTLPSLARRTAAALALLLASAADAHAQGGWRAFRRDFETAYGDVIAVWASPFHGRATDWSTALGVLAVAGVVTAYDDDVDAWVVRNPDARALRTVKFLREDAGFPMANLATASELIPLSFGLYFAGLASGTQGLQDAGLGCASAQHANSLARHLTYLLVKRDRPYIANGDQYTIAVPGGSWRRQSLPGGHVANAMACAAFVNERFELNLLEPMLYVVALGTGAARVADRRHWTSDTVLGAAMGFAVGRVVASRSRARAAERAATPATRAGGELDAAYAGTRVGVRLAF